ncbi:hypothetical protein LX64_04402 [Chitinophaga skermanii]|uniref:DoxX-like protein n=1 Tax=Chitinophaga skermanii TaxID=331697 RepID=A0A327Q5Z9_9BACT|nr:DoxX family protein [Chitinophaga skermanii]RAI99849.1 hypothetical protein LX64_04402 [Chitinophaga skermanii]
MKIVYTLDQLHLRARENKWLGYFTVFCRVALAAGFIPSGMVKILGERFTALPNIHPMGSYLEALHHTGYYYTFIGVVQVLAAIFLLIPRTATLGAVLYFPVILNICILSLAVRFDGSLISSPLMVLACTYLLCWDYHKFKYIFPFYRNKDTLPPNFTRDNRFPGWFFLGVFVTILAVGFTVTNVFSIMPRNSYNDCTKNCQNSEDPQACINFCDCVHNQGKPLDSCVAAYNKAIKTKRNKR